jgi:hypothetical protein
MLPIPATSCSNERSHVPAARICSKARAAIKPDTVEKLTIAYFNLRDRVDEVSKAIGPSDDVEDSRIDEAFENVFGSSVDDGAGVPAAGGGPGAARKRARPGNSASGGSEEEE